MQTQGPNESDGSAASRRGFLRTAAAGAATVGVAAGAAGTATAQETDDSTNQAETPGTPTEGGDGNATEAAGEGGESGHEGQLVLTDGLLAMGVALVLGVLSPILFAIYLAVGGDGIEEGGNSGSGGLERIDSRND